MPGAVGADSHHSHSHNKIKGFKFPKVPHKLQPRTTLNPIGRPDHASQANISDTNFLSALPSDMLRNYYPSSECGPTDVDDVAITLVTATSMDRLWILEFYCDEYLGDISVSVYLGTSTEGEVLAALPEMCSSKLADGSFLLSYWHPSEAELAASELFPVNALRNMAIAEVATSHYLYVDIDFWPSANLYPVLHDDAVREVLSMDYKAALVVPAFERIQSGCDMNAPCGADVRIYVSTMPRDKSRLEELIAAKKVHVFERFVKAAHGSTDTLKWLTQEDSSLRSIECIESNRYEPYLVLRKCEKLPPYQVQFTGYGKNKISHILHLRQKGYRFSVVGGSFLIHYPHKTSKARKEWEKMSRTDKSHLQNMRRKGVTTEQLESIEQSSGVMDFHRVKMDTLFVAFKEWLDIEEEAERESEEEKEKRDDDDVGTELCEGATDDQALAILPSN
jgi:hypothetical protein